MHASFESPDIFASIKNQLSSGGKDLIIAKIINRVKIALKVLVFIFLLIESKFFIPENSILIRCKPIKPIIIFIFQLPTIIYVSSAKGYD